jgi:hypothetical protein
MLGGFHLLAACMVRDNRQQRAFKGVAKEVLLLGTRARHGKLVVMAGQYKAVSRSRQSESGRPNSDPFKHENSEWQLVRTG